MVDLLRSRQPATRGMLAQIASIAALVMTVDEALKMFVRQTMDTCTAHAAVGCDYLKLGGGFGFLHLENAGSALGFIQGSAVWVGLAIMGLVLIPLCARRVGGARFAAAIGAGLMSGGGISNLFDRLAFGSVTDFIVLGGAIVINLGDIALLAGMILLIRAIWQARPSANTGGRSPWLHVSPTEQ